MLQNQSTREAKMLCLGDSYTIGEGIPLHQSFPYQTMQLLRNAGHQLHAPEIVATTGWTTFELVEHLRQYVLQEKYDIVTLLIGVNNQYRGLEVSEYANDLNDLLNKAIDLAGQQPQHVIMLSIPDWGITPFAAAKDKEAISQSIATFNAVALQLCTKKSVTFCDITTQYQQIGDEAAMLASDQLHPSGKLYAEWSRLVADFYVTRCGWNQGYKG